jgi:hypothetical protein
VTADYSGDRGNAAIEELWEEVFSVRSEQRLYNWIPFEFESILSSERMVYKDYGR